MSDGYFHDTSTPAVGDDPSITAPAAGPLVITVHGTPAPIARRIDVNDNGCWLWQGALYPDGYAMVSYRNKTHQGHRLMYRLLVGEVPAGLVLDHLCRVRKCVGPQHLEPVTPRENLRRGNTPTGWSVCQTCGGEFSELRGQRRCLVCLARYEQARLARKAQQERERRARLKAAAQ